MRKNSRGFTLLEVMVATGILAVAGLGTLSLIGVLTRSNTHVSAQTEALALATQLVSEIQNAPYLAGAGNQDPGLLAIGEVTAPVPGSTITTVGRFHDGQTPVVDPAVPARFSVRYELSAWNEPVTLTPGGVDVLVTVDNDRRTRAFDSTQRLMAPVQLMVRKEFVGSPAVANGAFGDLRW